MNSANNFVFICITSFFLSVKYLFDDDYRHYKDYEQNDRSEKERYEKAED